MLNQNLVKDVLDESLSTGACFAEIFLENTRRENIRVVNGVVEESLAGIDYGLGLRIFDGTNAIYSYTNDTSRENLMKMAKTSALTLKGNPSVACINFVKMNIVNNHTIKVELDQVHKKSKVELLKAASAAARGYDSLITQTIANFTGVVQNVLIANSEGLWAEDKRERTRAGLMAVASNETEKQTGFCGPGASMGYELYDKINIEEEARDAARVAVTALKADLCPSGTMPVVIDNGFGGVLFHEACGHSLEATSVAENTSVFSGKLNKQIASDLVTAIDDGTIPNYWGSCNIDDEGTPMQKNILIENGILKSYLIDKRNGLKMGMKSTGSGRRESYRYAPTSRMTNTYIANGKSTFDEIISNTEYGLYAAKMGGGSVSPATGEFNFMVSEAYIIRNGKIAEPVRGATLIGKGHEILLNIDMVGNNMTQGQGMCGSISGSIPTNVGEPTIRIKQIIVGGRK